MLIFEGCAHAPLYESVEEFNEKTLQFLQRQARVGVTSRAPDLPVVRHVKPNTSKSVMRETNR